jgi:hypothetical protein
VLGIAVIVCATDWTVSGIAFGKRQGVFSPLEAIGFSPLEVIGAGAAGRQRAQAAGWSLISNAEICYADFGAIFTEEFDDCFRACSNHHLCAQFSIGAGESRCRFAVSAHGKCALQVAPSAEAPVEVWHNAGAKYTGNAKQMIPEREGAQIHELDQADEGHFVELKHLRGHICNNDFATLGLAEPITLTLCKKSCADQRGCNFISFAPLDQTPNCRFALGNRSSCMPGKAPAGWPVNTTMWALASRTGDSDLPSSLLYQTGGCQSSCSGQPFAKNVTLLPLNATPQAVRSILGQLRRTNASKPSLYFMGESTSREMVLAALTTEQRETLHTSAHTLTAADHLKRREYTRGNYNFGQNEWISEIDLGTSKLTWDWSPFPYTSRFEWLVRHKFADGKDRPDALVIMGLGIHSCVWEPEDIQNHIWELEHMFEVLNKTSMPVVFVFGRLVNLFARYWWSTPAAINSCLVQFKAALRKLASDSCYPWMDVQAALDTFEDAYGAGADGVHLPDTPYNGASIRATLEMVKSRLSSDCL